MPINPGFVTRGFVARIGNQDEIRLEIRGTPAPKGSVTAFAIPGKNGGRPRAVITHGAAKKVQSWSAAVREVAATAVGAVDAPPFVAVPISVVISFRLLRPAGHYRNAGTLKPSAPSLSSTKPDIDKLARATLDALTGVVFDDDSRVAVLTVYKLYAAPGGEGASIHVARLRHEAEILDELDFGGAS